jgi:hypothetical protein
MSAARLVLVHQVSLSGQVAQLVEQRTENPRVGGSIPSLATIHSPEPLFVFFAYRGSASSRISPIISV